MAPHFWYLLAFLLVKHLKMKVAPLLWQHLLDEDSQKDFVQPNWASGRQHN